MSSPWIPWSSPTNVAFPNRRWSEKTCGFVKRFCPTSDASLQAALISGWVALFSHAAMRIRGQPRGRKLAKAPCGVTSSNRPSQFVGRFGLDVATAPKASQSLEVSSATTFFDRRLPLGEKENQKKQPNRKLLQKKWAYWFLISCLFDTGRFHIQHTVPHRHVPYLACRGGAETNTCPENLDITFFGARFCLILCRKNLACLV